MGTTGVKATVASLAFRFLRLASPPFGEVSSFVLFSAPFPLCPALLTSVRGAGALLSAGGTEGPEPPAAAGAAVSGPVSLLFAFSGTTFLFGWIIPGCFLESV